MKKFDACMTRGEMDLIEIRLRELHPVVDVFVFVEASVTHSGHPRKFVVKGQVYKLADAIGIAHERIRVVEIHDSPNFGDPWARERHQRESIWRGLEDAENGDILCFSDCDEIPRREAFGAYKPEDGPSKFEQWSCYYWLNCRGGGWGGSIIGTVEWMTKNPLSLIRNSAMVQRVIPHGGWHFSFLGGIAGIKSKLSDYAHQDCNLPHYQDERWIGVAINTPIDLFRRGNAWHFVDLDAEPHFLPHPVRDDPERFSHLVKRAKFTELWTSDEQICWLVDTWRRVQDLPGFTVEIGSWEGRTAVALANMIYPQPLFCVDTWRGNDGEPGGVLAGDRDIAGTFRKNISELTRGNVTMRVARSQDWLRSDEFLDMDIKFAHVDACHHYDAVYNEIAKLIPKIPVGGVICGDDFQSASRQRHDLAGGVQRAVEELLPGFEQLSNFWIYQRKS